jgi:hypothetical protein
MATEFTIKLEHHPGTLARVGGVLGDAGVNITAIQGMPCEGVAVVQVLVDDPGRAKAALRKAEIPYTTRDVLLVNILNEPGTLGDVAW